jgi:hypothetical protein
MRVAPGGLRSSFFDDAEEDQDPETESIKA